MIGLGSAALHLAVAVACGALIGSERQVRQRMAGLRTNALVALGAAGFVVFSQLFPNEVSPTRVAAQVVTGIGFLGAGIIFREGFTVHGLNTAATLWCTAAVGVIAGAGQLAFAGLMTGMVVFVNLGLRPLVKWLKRRTRAGLPIPRQIRVTAVGPPAQEAEIRALILRILGIGGLKVVEIGANSVEGGDDLAITVTVTADGVGDVEIEQAMSRLAAEPGLRRLSWGNPEEEL